LNGEQSRGSAEAILDVFADWWETKTPILKSGLTATLTDKF
jgi:hypothetical protein